VVLRAQVKSVERSKKDLIDKSKENNSLERKQKEVELLRN